MRANVYVSSVEKYLDIIHPTHVNAFLILLTELREVFDGDLDALIILCAVSVDVQGEGWKETLLTTKSLNLTKEAGINIQSIAQATGIPRETVRRKLSAMQEKGWVDRDDTGHWRPTRDSARDLEPATRATMAYISTVIEAFQKATSDAKI